MIIYGHRRNKREFNHVIFCLSPFLVKEEAI